MRKITCILTLCLSMLFVFACSKTDGGTTDNTNNNNNTPTPTPTPTPITPVWDANAWRGVWVTTTVYVVKESGQFSCRRFRCLNVGFFLLKIVVFVFLGTVV